MILCRYVLINNIFMFMQDLVRRHKEYVLHMTARCDEVNPRSAAEIVREIEANEKKALNGSIAAAHHTVKTEGVLTFFLLLLLSCFLFSFCFIFHAY